MSIIPNGLDLYEEEDWSLWDVLHYHLDDWHDVWVQYWTEMREDLEADPKVVEWWDRLEKVAPKILTNALALQMSHPLPPEIADLARRILANFGEAKMVRDKWSFSVAKDAIERLSGSSDRVAELLDVILACRFGDRTAAYLSRVARLYVYGFEVEALVMCRSALEAALQDVLPDETMSRRGFKMTGREYSLADRITAAERAGLFDSSQRRTAHLLRKAGNEALHTAPGFLQDGVPTAGRAIYLLAGLLESLSLE